MTGVERGRFECQARAVGAGLQYRAPAVSHPATEDGRYAPARDWRAELELPLLFKSGQHARQLVEPRLHFVAEAFMSRTDAGSKRCSSRVLAVCTAARVVE